MDFDILGLVRPGAVILTQTSTAFVIDTNPVSSLYIGSDQMRAVFAFTGEDVRYNSDGEPIGGTITGLKVTEGLNSVVLNVSGFHLSATKFYQMVDDVSSGLIQGRPLDLIFSGNDEFHGTAGDDIITDGAGHNIFMGGPGRDAINGGDGNDHMYGGEPSGGQDGGDALSGGGGSDYLQGNAGSDTLFGGNGSDRINGGADEDWIFGGADNDTINGNRGADTVRGEAGNDLLRGGQGNDSLNGGEGNDILQGDLGTDQLEGFVGADIFVFGPGTSPIGSAGSGLDVVQDFEEDDRLSLGFMPQALLIQTYLLNENRTVSEAQVTAQALLDGHIGGHEVALIYADANAAFMFWDSTGGGIIDSVVGFPLTSLPPSFTLSDFV